MDYIVGIDLGTTNFKSLVVDTDGNVVFKTSFSVETWHSQKGFVEQNPDYLWDLIQKLLIKTVENTPKKPIAVSFSAAMHSLIALDKDNKPLINAIIWADNRAEKQALELKKSKLGNQLFKATGTPIHPLSPLLKLAWLRENEPDIFTKTTWFCSIKEFIFFKLFSKKLIDLSIASATGLLNSNTSKWHKPSLEWAQVVENQLSKVVSPYHIELLNRNDFIPEWENVPIIIGASDGVLSSLSAGAIDENLTTITIGTSGAVRRIIKKGPLSIWSETASRASGKAKKGSKLFKYRLDEAHFVIGGATNNGGIALEWLTKKIINSELNKSINSELNKDFNSELNELIKLIKSAELINIGSDDLLFIPFILGERALIWDANVRGSFLNLSFEHTQAHFIRATLEGILFNLQHIHAAIEAELSESSAIFADGGFVQSPFLIQMLSDITNKPIYTRIGEDGGSLGAIMMAMKAINLSKNLLETIKILKPNKVIYPSENAILYRPFFEKYSAIIKSIMK
jgi:gluconokinase